MCAAGFNVNSRNYFKETPLHKACSIHLLQEEHVFALVECGADINARDCDGITPLLSLVQYDESCSSWVVDRSLIKKSIVELLLKRGADISLRSNDGRVVFLHRVLRLGWIQMISLLLDQKINKDIQDFAGNTILHEAAGSYSTDVIELLLDKGVDPLVRNNNEETACCIAYAQFKNREDSTAIKPFLQRLCCMDPITIWHQYGVKVDAKSEDYRKLAELWAEIRQSDTKPARIIPL